MKPIGDPEAVVSWVLAAMAGLVGAAAFIQTTGYFVTFMTGNAERAALGYFVGRPAMATAAILITVTFVAGVVVASLLRRHVWVNHPHGATMLTTISLAIATTVDFATAGFNAPAVTFIPILFVAFGIGALNTSFCDDKKGEVSVPLSYVTGTLVKLGQGIERHISGGQAKEWNGYFLLWLAFVAGGVIGAVVSLVITGGQMLLAATVICGGVALYTYRLDERASILG